MIQLKILTIFGLKADTAQVFTTAAIFESENDVM